MVRQPTPSEEERAERRLVQRREADPRDHEDDAELVDQVCRPVEVELLQDRVAELYDQHAQVEHDAPGNLEERRVELPVPDGEDDPPPDTDVEGETGPDARVCHQTQQDRPEIERLVALPVKDAHEGSEREAGAADRHQRHDAAALPETPGH
jgi:hypothetical protein